jgi:hypothetical protein
MAIHRVRCGLVASLVAGSLGIGPAVARAQGPGGSLAGHVLDAGGHGVAGVAVAITDGTSTIQRTTDAAGAFSATGLPPASYTVTPTLAGHEVAPAARTITLLGGAAIADFVVSTPTYAVSGRVVDANGSPLAGVGVTLSGGAAGSATTDAGGGYRFTGIGSGAAVMVTPALAGFSFAPAVRTADDVRADVTLAPIAAASGVYRRYFAEGASNAFFSTRIALLNPGSAATVAHLRFQKSDGGIVEHEVALAGLARATIDPAAVGAANSDFATVVESDQPLVADRTMHWDATGYGSHAETSLPEPLTTWYFAEGSTTGSFQLFYLLQNPGPTAAQVEVRYLRPAPAAPVVKSYAVAPASRRTIYVNQEDPALDETDVSAVVTVTNGVPIVAERAMYTNAAGQIFGAGHESAGLAAPSAQWFLAEGATGPFFHQFILVANPTATAAPLDFRYLLTDGRVVLKSHTVAPNSRLTVGVHAEDPLLAAGSMSTVVTSTNGVPVLVERAMWWPASGPEWYEAHDAAGATATGTKWAVADGQAGGPAGADTFLLIANTAIRAGSAAVTLVFEDGGTATKRFPLLPSSRFTVPVSGAFPEAAGRRFGAIVESVGDQPVPIVVERAIYESPGGVTWAAGSNLLATRLQGPVEAAVIPPPVQGQATAPVTTAGVLGGDPETPAIAAIPDVVAERETPAGEVSTDPDGRRVARTAIEIAFARTATVAQVDAVLDAIAGRIVNAIAGVPILVVRIPDPGSYDGLQAVVTRAAGLPAVDLVNDVLLPEPAELPDTHVGPGAGPRSSIDHLLAARAPAAWNVKAALDSPGARTPQVIVTDFFGDGTPNSAINASLNPWQFTLAGANQHGYHVLGTIVGTFPSVPTLSGGPPDKVVGLFPGRSDVQVIDLVPTRIGLPNLPSYANDVLRWVRDASGAVVVNSSLQFLPPMRTAADILPYAQAWIEKVRTAGVDGTSLEDRFVHAHAGGNAAGTPSSFASEPAAAALLPNLVDTHGAPLSHLANTLVVENRMNTASEPFEAGCLNATSNRDGNIGAVGTDVFSLIDRGTRAGDLSGTSMASPVVAALAEYVWALDPSLAARDVVAKIIGTARPGTTMTDARCTPFPFARAPSIDAYAAVLAVDRGLAAPLVRSTLLDVTGAGASDLPDGVFDERDVNRFLDEFAARGGLTFDYSRFDLNGDGRTGGTTSDRFDLDASTPAAWTTIAESIDGERVTFDETKLTDLQILCYYAFSPLYAGDPAVRTTLLPGCHSSEDVQSASDIRITMAAVNPLTSTEMLRLDDDVSSTDEVFQRPSIGTPMSGVFSPNDPVGPNPSAYTVSATASMPTPTRRAFLPATGTFTGTVSCQANGAGVDDGTGGTVLPVLPRLSAETKGTFDVSTRLDGHSETPSMTVDLSGFLSRGAGTGDVNSGVSLSGTMVIGGLSGGVTLPDVRIAVRNYSTPSDTLSIQEPVSYHVTVTSPGYVEVHWEIDAACAAPFRAASEGASGGFQLSYTVTH